MLSQKLRTSQQYQFVYKHGRRYDSRYVTLFVVPNEQSVDRFGITASRRAAKNAVDRNRMKRLLREAIRTVNSKLPDNKAAHYDWVLNAKRSLLEIKLETLSEELQRIVVAVVGENHSPAGTEAIEASIPHQLKNI